MLRREKPLRPNLLTYDGFNANTRRTRLRNDQLQLTSLQLSVSPAKLDKASENVNILNVFLGSILIPALQPFLLKGGKLTTSLQF
jgi:hypothetical protein